MDLNIIYNQDALTGLKGLPDKYVNCIVTSPPYWALRDYGVGGQLGLEATPEEYVSKMVMIFREAKRVLKDDGTLWLNIGDSYYSGSKKRTKEQVEGKSTLQGRKNGNILIQQNKITSGLKPKDLAGIPWMLAFALRADGWYLRQDIIWSKPNPMPESVVDRCTKSHEYIFLFSKTRKYYFDYVAIQTEITDSSVRRLLQDIELQKGSDRIPGKTNGPMKAKVSGRKPRPGIDVNGGNQATGDIPMGIHGRGFKGHSGNYDSDGNLIGTGKANRRSVWTISTQPFKDDHFATFPEELPRLCILAGCPDSGIVLDPFMGAGSTGLVASKLNRNFIGFELNPKYIAMGNKRLKKELGLFYGTTTHPNQVQPAH